jgi:hypothetical protein
MDVWASAWSVLSAMLGLGGAMWLAFEVYGKDGDWRNNARLAVAVTLAVMYLLATAVLAGLAAQTFKAGG